MATSRYTVEEIIQSLKRSSIKTVVVEGESDVKILRDIEERLKKSAGDVDFFPAGDKRSVLKIAEADKEFTQARVTYMADSDLWLFTDDRLKYPKVTFTNGYSIENVCIQSPNLLALVKMRPGTEALWTASVNSLSEWFCAEISYFLDNQDPILDVDIKQIVDFDNGGLLKTPAQARIHAAPPLPGDIKDQVQQNPLLFVRGKQLLFALREVLAVQEGNLMKPQSLASIGAKLENPSIDRLLEELSASLA